MTTIATIRRAALRALIPPAREPLSQWIEKNLILPESTSALPGRVRLWPWQREIADAITDPGIERITLQKPVRVGFTTLLMGAVGHYASNDPCPVILLMPTEDDARGIVVDDLEPLFAATPALAGILQDDTEGVRNTLTSRRFPGGSLKVISARAPRNLRRHNARVLLVDEADAAETGAEGDPITLAERRTLSFANRKIIIGSTPIFEDTSAVLRSYALSDARVYEVPCPECGALTEIKWAHIVWETDRPETARFRCPHCETLIGEQHKAAMVTKGAWRATAPEVKGHAGFRLNALISLLANASWPKLVREFLAAREDPARLQVFTNTILSEGWREQGAEIDDGALASRAEPFGLDNIPREVLWLTAGVDVADDRLECTVAGWSRNATCYLLGHVVIWGSVQDDTTWAELDTFLRSRWSHPLGGKIGIDACGVDSGDSTDRVYSFCFPRIRRRIMAFKGMAGARPALSPSKSKIKGGGRLWLVGVDTLKAQLFNKLQHGSSIRFSNSLEPSFYEQITSERRIVRYARGQPVRRFERISGRAKAEALDATIYATAARTAVTIQPDTREAELRQVVAAQTAPGLIRSRWMERR